MFTNLRKTLLIVFPFCLKEFFDQIQFEACHAKFDVFV